MQISMSILHLSNWDKLTTRLNFCYYLMWKLIQTWRIDHKIEFHYLNPTLIRLRQIDRKTEFPLPDHNPTYPTWTNWSQDWISVTWSQSRTYPTWTNWLQNWISITWSQSRTYLTWTSWPQDWISVTVRATAGGGARLAGDPKLNIFTEQLLQIAHLAGDPKRKG